MPKAMFLRSRLLATRGNFFDECRGIHVSRMKAGVPRVSRRWATCGTGSEAEREYHGPLSRTFRNLKIFSLSSLVLASSMTPFFFIVETTVPLSGRIGLAGIAVGTSGISTGLVSWCGAPYVTRLRRLGGGIIEMETRTLFLRARHTRVYDAGFLRNTGRGFAKWELAEAIEGSEREGEEEQKTETVAETRDEKGRLIGQWIVEWKGRQGKCRAIGQVVRHFYVHDELLEDGGSV